MSPSVAFLSSGAPSNAFSGLVPEVRPPNSQSAGHERGAEAARKSNGQKRPAEIPLRAFRARDPHSTLSAGARSGAADFASSAPVSVS
jgi:hypothetical protein